MDQEVDPRETNFAAAKQAAQDNTVTSEAPVEAPVEAPAEAPVEAPAADVTETPASK